MRRLLLLALVAPLVALGCALATSSPAAAACDPGPIAPHLREATLVVTGTVTGIEQLPNRQVLTVEVQRVYRGEAPTVLQLQGPTPDRACALPATVGEQWLLVSQGTSSPPAARADWGSQQLTPGIATQVADVLGSGKAPTPAAPPATGEVSLNRVDDSEPHGFWQVALPGAVLLVGGLLILLLARALGRTRTARA